MLSKKVRRKVRIACGLEPLSKEDKLIRAQEIIDDYELRQQICLKHAGLTHKDIERVMLTIINKTVRDAEEDVYPEKYGKTPENPVNYIPISKSKMRYRTWTREEVEILVAASNLPVEPHPVRNKPVYDTYHPEEVAALIAGNYHPERFKYLRKK